MKSFITGINGFVGTYLTRALLARGDSVSGVYHPDTYPGIIEKEFPRVRLGAMDIMDVEALTSFLAKEKPDRVYHLAAQSHVPTSWADPEGTFRINVLGAMNVLKAAARKKKHPRVLFISSGDVYGDRAGARGVLNEDSPISPQNPYAASKASAEWMARTLAVPLKVPLVCVRPFNHIGPGQAPTFVASDFARQIARIEAGIVKPVMRVGTLDARKDFTDVRDMVDAYLLALEKAPSGSVYNLCSGKSHSIREILNMLIALSAVNPKVIQDPSKQRVTQSSVVKAGATRFIKLTGWKRHYTLRQTLGDILDYWRQKVRLER